MVSEALIEIVRKEFLWSFEPFRSNGFLKASLTTSLGDYLGLDAIWRLMCLSSVLSDERL